MKILQVTLLLAFPNYLFVDAQCNAGFFYKASNCNACQPSIGAGNYCPAGNTPSAGVPCPLGKCRLINEASYTCSACPTGRVQPNTEQTSCETCLAGTFASGGNVTVCQACSGNSFSFTDSDQCTVCGAATSYCSAGSFYNRNNCPGSGFDQDGCMACPPNSDSAAGSDGISGCGCNSGFYDTDNDAANDAVSCAACGIRDSDSPPIQDGYYCPAGGSSSAGIPCAAGFYRGPGDSSDACIACTTCTDSQYEARACQGGGGVNDRTCQACTSCDTLASCVWNFCSNLLIPKSGGRSGSRGGFFTSSNTPVMTSWNGDETLSGTDSLNIRSGNPNGEYFRNRGWNFDPEESSDFDAWVASSSARTVCDALFCDGDTRCINGGIPSIINGGSTSNNGFSWSIRIRAVNQRYCYLT